MQKHILLALALGVLAAPASAQDDKTIAKLFQTTFQSSCLGQDFGDMSQMQSWELTWRPEYADTDSTATLYEFFCGAGAYNAIFAYYLVDEYGEALPVAFAVPHFDVRYEGDDFESDVTGIDITGYGTQLLLTNAQFEPESQTIVTNARWRGLGDASSNGTWVFDDGRFRLVRYLVDATYNGEVDPQSLVDFGDR